MAAKNFRNIFDRKVYDIEKPYRHDADWNKFC